MTAQRDPPLVRLSAAVFRRLLAVLPRGYTERHGADAQALLTQLARDAYRHQGGAGCALVTVAAVVDLAARLPSEYVKVGAIGGDLSFALRSMRRYRLTTLIGITTLAAGIGLNAAVFTVVDWVLVRPLPYPAPQQLVRIWTAGVAPITPPADLTASEVRALATAQSLRAATAYSVATRVARADGMDPFHATVVRLDGDWFATFAVKPEIGRTIVASETAAGAPVIVISETMWRRRLFGDPSVVGRTLTIDGKAFAIVGVMPQRFAYPADADLWRPLTTAEREDDDRDLAMVGRLSDTTPERASVELATLMAKSPQSRRVWAEDLRQTGARNVSASLIALWASALLVLVMTCANVAALIGARGADRVGELTVRAAIGATRARLVQQLVTESLLLAAIGGGAGLLLGNWALHAMLMLAPSALPRAAEMALDARVVLAGTVAICAIGVLIGSATAWQASRADPHAVFSGPQSVRIAVPSRSRRFLVGIQAAIAVVLAVTAVLSARGLQRLVTVDHGFAADRLIAVDLYLRGGGVPAESTLFAQLIDAAEGVSGVRSAAVGLRAPQQLAGLRIAVRPEGSTDAASIVTIRPVTAGYFDTTGIPLIAGRTFDARDRRGAPRTVIVNNSFIRRVLGGGDALGIRLSSDLFKESMVIVGAAADVTPAGDADRPALYLSLDQLSVGAGTLLVRTAGDPRVVLPALATRLRAVAPSLALDRVHRVAESLEESRSGVRFTTLIASFFAVLALFLAVVSVYGMTAGDVVSRWHELGIRLALGASPAGALWTVVRSAAIAVAIGAATGAVGALAASRLWLATRLPAIEVADSATLIVVASLLAIVGWLAAVLACRRVIQADPAATLRID